MSVYACTAIIGVNGHADTGTAARKRRKIWHCMATKHCLESLETGLRARETAKEREGGGGGGGDREFS